MNNSRIMIFEPNLYGHHSSYILCLLEYLLHAKLNIDINFVVSHHFFKIYSDISHIVSQAPQSNINFIPISQQEQATLDMLKLEKFKFKEILNRENKIDSLFEHEINLFNQYAEKLQTAHGYIMYIDDGRLITITNNQLYCPFSGIYFTPQFHYAQFGNYSLDSVRQTYDLKQKFLLSRFLRHSQLHTLFCLDLFAIEQIKIKYNTTKVTYLPDPVRFNQKAELQVEAIKKNLNIPHNKKIFLLFGSLGSRKGIYELLKAILLLPPESCEKICLVLVGQINPGEDENWLNSRVSLVSQYQPIDIIEHYKFVPDSDVLAYFQLADVVLATYPRHVGMSGILLLAAAASKPVLASEFGLMGEVTRQYNLGITVDATRPEEIAKGLMRCLQESPEYLYDKNKMKQLVKQHSPENFATTLIHHFQDE